MPAEKSANVNKKPRTGNLYRRWRGKRYALDADVPGVIYLTYKIDGRPATVCLHTRDIDEARRLQADHMGRIKWGGRQEYLRAVVAMGKQAERELGDFEAVQSNTTLGEAWAEYESSRRRPRSGTSTMANYRREWQAFVDWVPKGVGYMADVTATMSEKYVRHLEQKRSANTVGKHITTLRRFWNVLMPGCPNPWEGVRTIRIDEKLSYRPLSHEEVRAVCMQLKGEWRDLCVIAYYTALRRKDAVLIRVRAVNLKDSILEVDPPHKTRGKKKARLRIPLLPELRERLAARIEGRAEDEFLLSEIAAQHERSAPRISKLISDAFKTAGVGDTPDGHASFHSFRVTFITMMDLAGAPHRVTDRITNHAPATMHDRYSKPDTEAARVYIRRALKPLRLLKS